jgi:ubiquinone/menaquinone biosynthesis C-methylase UbiE
LGYPGADAEAKLALERLNDGLDGGATSNSGAPSAKILLDVSCGPGIITTRIAAGLRGYDALVASDVSEAMTKRAAERLDTLAATTRVLRQRRDGDANANANPDANANVNADANANANANASSVGLGLDPAPARLPAFAAVRADVSDLPFADASVSAVHSSAGAHCWPDPELGFREIARVLKPGGVFVASTVVLANPLREKYVENGTCADGERYQATTWDVNTPFWDADAVVSMIERSGLVDVEVVREDKCFVMIAARKR